jgi:Bacterial tandem repeat domain 1
MNRRLLSRPEEATPCLGRGLSRRAIPALAGLLLTTAVPAVAAPQFVAYHNQTSAGHQAYFNSLSVQGYRMRSLSVYNAPGSPRYAAVWVKQAGPPFVAFHGLSPSGYQAFFDTWVPKGYRPTLVTATGAGSDAVFAAVFEKDSTPFVAKHGISGSQFASWCQWASNHGYILRCATVYGTASEPVYAGIWEKNTSNIAWWVHFNLTAAEYQNLFNIYGGTGKRLVFVTLSAGQKYLGLWSNIGGDPWVAYHGMTGDGYQAKFDALVPPYYPTCVQAQGAGSDIRFAAIFEK